MITLGDLSPTELQYLRSKWASEQTELDKEKARRMERLTNKLEGQAADATAETQLAADLAHAQAVLAALQAANAPAELINAQNAVVSELQDQVNSFGLSTSYVSNTDALLQLMEMDELQQGSVLRAAKITEIDALLP